MYIITLAATVSQFHRFTVSQFALFSSFFIFSSLDLARAKRAFFGPKWPHIAPSGSATFFAASSLMPYNPSMDFQLVTSYTPKGDQPRAIDQLMEGLAAGERHQVLLGVTGSGKTFTMAKVIEQSNRPALILAHNKTLAAQLYHEFKQFFPSNAVEYFVSY